MTTFPPVPKRDLKTVEMNADLAVIGGGVAGTCAAIAAAREGLKVILIQDRPVLGGNASSEVRLWVLGATAHMTNNNRWAREGGIIDEILVENMWRNREGNTLIFDTILLEKIVEEPNITLLLNTAAFEATKAGDAIKSVRAFCSQNSTLYEINAPLFCDASGDGVVAFLSGAVFRMGAESREEFGEKFAPDKEYGELLGHSIYFYSKDTGVPVKFVPPSYAIEDIERIPRYRRLNEKIQGCRLWWIEYGGRLDTVHDTETIKWELWKVVYGVWNYIKNSGKFPDAGNLTLEWVGTVPGKRESRRFEGDYILRQQDLIEQREFPDAVSYGGWSIDLHPADGVYSELPGCNQWHSRGMYQIPYRCLYSRNIDNLFLAGRIISSSHVAFGSTRVIGTCSHSAQAVGVAAAICLRDGCHPKDVLAVERLSELRIRLLRSGQFIPRLKLSDPDDLARKASIRSSSEYGLDELPAGGPLIPLNRACAQMIPVVAGKMPECEFMIDVASPSQWKVELRTSDHPENHTPDVLLSEKTIELLAGNAQSVRISFDVQIDQPRYVVVVLTQNEAVSVHTSERRVTGLLSLFSHYDQDRSAYAGQYPTKDIGVESFAFWCPERRPNGRNLAIKLTPPASVFGAMNVVNGISRPTSQPNAWVAAATDLQPILTLNWSEAQTIRRVELDFDTDFDHPMESSLLGHPEDVMPFCVKDYSLWDGADRLLTRIENNHQTRNIIKLASPVTTQSLQLRIHATHGSPAAVFAIRCF